MTRVRSVSINNPETPFLRALAEWEAAKANSIAFDLEAQARLEAWKAENPEPIRYVITNADRERTEIAPGRYRTPYLNLSSDPADMECHADHPFDYRAAYEHWIRHKYIVLRVDGLPIAKYSLLHGDLPTPDFIQDLIDHSERVDAFYEPFDQQSIDIWGQSYDAMMEAMRTPAETLPELATKIEIFALNMAAGPFTGFYAIQARISAEMNRLMGSVQDFEALKIHRSNAAQDMREEIEDDLSREKQALEAAA